MADFDTNDGQQFITGRLDFETGTPPIGDTGDGQQFITDRIDLAEFTKKEAAATAVFLTTYGGYSVPVG